MSRKRYQLRMEAEERWPTLFQFLAAYCHEDWPEFHGTPQGAVEAAVADYPLQQRQNVLREWRDWMNTVGTKDDIRADVNDGLRVNVYFHEPTEARDFMNMAYDKLIGSVRSETELRWNPEWKR